MDITYEVVWYNMVSKINVVCVEKDSVESYLRVIRSTKIVTADMVDSNGKVSFMFHQSGSNYGGVRSAIRHVYIFAGVKIP